MRPIQFLIEYHQIENIRKAEQLSIEYYFSHNESEHLGNDVTNGHVKMTPVKILS